MQTDGRRFCVDSVLVPDISVVLSLYDNRKTPICIPKLNSILQYEQLIVITKQFDTLAAMHKTIELYFL